MYKQLISIILFSLIIGCQAPQNGYEVEYQVHGKLMEIMQQNQLEARVTVDENQLNGTTYGLGAIEGLKGEILISAGKIFTSVATPDSILIDEPGQVAAALLVTAEVNTWQKVEAEEAVPNMDALARLIANKAEQAGLSSSGVVPIRIIASSSSIDWHIINASLAQEQNHQAYKASGRSGNIGDQPVEITGFYSKNHEGVFTHHGSFLHLHVITADGQLMGHVDELHFNRTWTLFLPKADKL